jgi:hypothetical protein
MDVARSVTATFTQCAVPAAPELTAPATAVSGVDYEVSWTATSPIGSYELQEATDAAFATAVTIPVTGTSQTRNHVVSPVATYYTRVRALDTCGGQPIASAWSATRTTVVREPGASTAFHTLPPCRVIDTRGGVGALGGPALVGGATRMFGVGDTCGIPLSATAISVNVTVTEAPTAGYVGLYPGDIAWPGVSTINFAAGQTRANNAVAQLSGDGTATLAVRNGSAGTVHFILDVNGYFQ